jgi:hypothetical protein
MNYLRIKPASSIVRLAAMLFVLLAMDVAQAAELKGGGRWLLIFDTSTTMKKFQPGTVAELKKLLNSSADAQIQDGDSVGVWTVNQQLNGQFPTFTWSAEEKDVAFSNLVVFLHHQSYSSPSRLATIAPSLNYVVANSRRLTVVLFTDGQSDIAGTTYDDGVNQMFHDTRDDQRKELQPIVVVLRSQFGNYIGCTINYPPSPMNWPPFPPPPAPPVVAAPKPTNTAAPITSLVIVGNAVSTNGSVMIPQPKRIVVPPPNPPAMVITQAVIVPKPVVTNPIVVAMRATNPPPVVTMTNPPPVVAAKTNPVILPVMMPATNSVAASVTEPPQNPNRKWIFIGAGILVIATVLALVVIVRSRRLPQTSLISSSMQDDQRRH